ncbi:hypothetical protein KEM55_005130 [Ascosphaera atra]|nr:hypothetical protein KEM55_005130 [Ascosphaera atra]
MAPKKTEKATKRSAKGKEVADPRVEEHDQNDAPTSEKEKEGTDTSTQHQGQQPAPQEESPEQGETSNASINPEELRGVNDSNTCPDKEGGAGREERMEEVAATKEASTQQQENDEGTEEKADEGMKEAEVEALLHTQRQQFVQELAQQQREQRRQHEEEIASLRQSLAAQHVEEGHHANHAQPPTAPASGVPEAASIPNEALTGIMSLPQSLQSDVANLKRSAVDHPEAPPTTRQCTETGRESNSTAPSSTSAIPGLPAEVAEAVNNVVQDASHPAYGMSPNDVALLRHKCRPQGLNPRDKLSTDNPHNYQAWKFTLREKFTRDWPLYLTEHEKITSALSFLEGDLFIAMQGWLTDPHMLDKSYDSFLNEVQTTLGVHFQETDTKKELDSAIMIPSETVTTYHARLRALWIRAGTRESDRLTKFRASLLPSLADPLMGRSFSTTNELLQAASEVENYRKQRQLDRSRSSAVQPNISRDRKPRAFQFSKNESRSNASTPSSSTPSVEDQEHNKQFFPTINKPNGWRGPWWDPMDKRPKLTNALRHQLINQQRCWSCRGAGHLSTDSICPFTAKRGQKTVAAVSLSSNNNTAQQPTIPTSGEDQSN